MVAVEDSTLVDLARFSNQLEIVGWAFSSARRFAASTKKIVMSS